MIPVVCAIITQDNRTLVCQRPLDKNEGGKWEFPGGKVEAGESFEAALIREIEEELGAHIRVGEALTPVNHGKIRLLPFRCEIAHGNLLLKEHLALCWVNAQEAEELDWAKADLPILQEIDLLTE